MPTMLIAAFVVLLQQSTQPSPGVRGRIEGTVVRVGSNEPIPGAKVTVTAVSLAPRAQELLPVPIPVVTTGRDGRFLVPNLEDGTYRIFISADGFVRQEYGQRVFPGQGTLLNVKRGDVPMEIVVTMTPTGNVSGRVVDTQGRPAVGSPVQLMKAAYNAAGLQILQGVANSRTNDRGEYRIYWVTPGRYYLASGMSAAERPAQGTGPNDSTELYTFTFYPGTTDRNRAAVIDIRPGDERVIDVSVGKQQRYKLRGRLVDPVTGQPPASADVAITAAALSGGFASRSYGRAYNPQTGFLEVGDLMPGAYVADITTVSSSARVPFEIVNADIEGLSVVLSRGSSLTGRILMEAGADLPKAFSRVTLRLASPQNAALAAFSISVPPSADGTFRFENVLPGEYQIVGPNDVDLYVKSILFNGNEVLDGTVRVDSAMPASPVFEILVSPNVGQIDGVVVDDRLRPIPGAHAVLVPILNGRHELFKTASTDQFGRFTMRGISPGEYNIFAWEALEAFGYFDPELRVRLQIWAKSIRVGESSKQNIELRAIPDRNDTYSQ